MDTTNKQALATLTTDELKTMLAHRLPIAPELIIATREQLIQAVLELRRAA